MILSAQGDVSLVETLGPPVKECGRADEGGLRLQGDTALGLDVLQLLNRAEMAIDERGISERPQMFRGLEFGGVRRQEEEVQMVWHAQALGAVPACPIQDKDDLPGGTRADGLRESREFGLKERDIDAGRQVKDRATRGRMNKADQVAPFIAVLDRGQWAFAVETPDFVQDGF